MEDNEFKIEVTDKNCIGYNEVYWEFFECPNCHNDNLVDSYKFCPDCGYKVKFNLTKSFSSKEEIIINTGSFKGILAKVYDFNRRTGKVTVRIDGNELTFDYKDIIRKND